MTLPAKLDTMEASLAFHSHELKELEVMRKEAFSARDLARVTSFGPLCSVLYPTLCYVLYRNLCSVLYPKIFKRILPDYIVTIESVAT